MTTTGAYPGILVIAQIFFCSACYPSLRRHIRHPQKKIARLLPIHIGVHLVSLYIFAHYSYSRVIHSCTWDTVFRTVCTSSNGLQHIVMTRICKNDTFLCSILCLDVLWENQFTASHRIILLSWDGGFVSPMTAGRLTIAVHVQEPTSTLKPITPFKASPPFPTLLKITLSSCILFEYHHHIAPRKPLQNVEWYSYTVSNRICLESRRSCSVLR